MDLAYIQAPMKNGDGNRRHKPIMTVLVDKQKIMLCTRSTQEHIYRRKKVAEINKR